MPRGPREALDELAFRERDSVPGFQLVSCQEVGVPLYLVRTRAQLRLEVEAPPLQSVILRLVALRDRSLEEVSQLLKLNPRMVASVVREMELGRFVSVSRHNSSPSGEVISLQAKFRGTGLSQWISRLQVHEAAMAMDGLTGAWMVVPGPRTRLHLGKLADLQIRPIMPLVDEPLDSAIVGKAFSEHVHVPSLGDLRQRDSLTATILEVLAVEPWYVRAQLLSYGTEDRIEEFRVFWKQARQPNWEIALQGAEADDLRPIPTDPEPVQSPGAAAPAAPPVVHPPAIQSLNVWEHRPTMIKAIEASRTRLMIVSPWITAEATDEHILRRIEEALKRGVSVFIGYGIAEDTTKEDKPPSAKVMQRLKALAKNRKLSGRLVLRRLVTHEKVLLKDDDLYVVGSFNWLSFRGDRKRGIRRETSVVLRDVDTVKRAWDERLKDFALETEAP
jgi:hypothetical protein